MSLNVNPVVWFEMPVQDLARAKQFYESIFEVQLNIQQMDPSLIGGAMEMAFFPMEMNSAGAGGSLVKSEGYTPSHQGTMIYFAVTDINAVLDKVDKHGGKTFFRETSIGQYGFIGLFQDTEGNRVGLHTMK